MTWWVCMWRKKDKQPNLMDDKGFFMGFYEEYKGFLFYIAQKYTQDPIDCEDIVQESILRLLNHIQTLRQLDQNRTCKYIALTVRSAFLDHERKKHTAQTFLADDRMMERLLQEEKSMGQGTEGMPMEILMLKLCLSERDWMVLENRYILGYSYEEIAGQLGLTQEHIRMIVSRAKEKARRILCSETRKGEEEDAGSSLQDLRR